jgi:hypothetical protein
MKALILSCTYLYILATGILLLGTVGRTESLEKKAKEIERKLDTVIVEGQKQIDYFDAVVFPWLDEQDRKRKEKYCNSVCNPHPDLNGNGRSMCTKYCIYDVNGKYLHPRGNN